MVTWAICCREFDEQKFRMSWVWRAGDFVFWQFSLGRAHIRVCSREGYVRLGKSITQIPRANPHLVCLAQQFKLSPATANRVMHQPQLRSVLSASSRYKYFQTCRITSTHAAACRIHGRTLRCRGEGRLYLALKWLSDRRITFKLDPSSDASKLRLQSKCELKPSGA